LFAALTRQLEGAGAIVRSGALLDASMIQAAARRPKMSEGKTSKADPDARFGANNEKGRFTFGYKLPIAADGGAGLVRAVAGDRDVVVGFVLHFWALTYRIFPSISIFPNRRTAVQLRRVLEGMNCHNVEVCASRNTQRSIKRRERQNQCDCG